MGIFRKTCLLLSIAAVQWNVSVAGEVSMTLDQCIETALQKSDVIKMEKEKLVESDATVKEARTGFLPKFSAQASFTQLDERPYLDASSMGDFFGGLAEPFLYLAYKDTAGGSPPDLGLLQALSEMGGGASQSDDGKIYMGDDKLYNLIFTVQQPLFTGFKVLNGYRAAQSGRKAAEENRKMVRRDLIFNVKKSFFGVLQVQQSVTVIDTSIRQLEGIVRDLENMMELGMVGEQEVMKARVQLYNIQLTKVQVKNGVTVAKAALCNTMGIPEASALELEYNAAKPSDVGLPAMEELIDRAQKTQSELKVMEYQREVLRHIVKINRANYVPNLVAMGNYNIKRPNRSYEPEFYNSWDVTLALQMNLFDWGEGWHKKTKAESQLRQLEIGITQAKNGIALGIEKGYLDVQVAFEKIGIAEKALEQSKKSYEIISDRKDFGAAKNADLLDAQRTLTEATINYHNGIINYYLMRSALEYLLEENS